MKSSFLDQLGLNENEILDRDQLKKIVGGNEYPRYELKCYDDDMNVIDSLLLDFGEQCPEDSLDWFDWCEQALGMDGLYAATCY